MGNNLKHDPVCPVCETLETRFFQSVAGRHYWRCEQCLATFQDPSQLPSVDEEKAEYDRHENQIEDSGYRRFLNRLAAPLQERLKTGAEGLDFGCGPGPALAAMMAEAGFPTAIYDPIYFPDQRVLGGQYDFITCTEVVEHLHHPAKVFTQLNTLLKPGGWLGVMTCFQTDDDRFASWHYRRDPTHVVFYREATMAHIARRLGWSCLIPGKDVALFCKE